MPTLKRSMILSCFLLLAAIVQAQTRTISGKVTIQNKVQAQTTLWAYLKTQDYFKKVKPNLLCQSSINYLTFKGILLLKVTSLTIIF